mgnify:CR=1
MELDEISRSIGRLEEAVKSVKETQESQWRKLDKIDNYIVSHKVWIAGIAGSASLIMSMLVYFIKDKIFGK